MYIPELSGNATCGEYRPPLTDIQRQSSCDAEYILKTMKCLYTRGFNPLYTEKNCACITCYDPSTWNRIVKHANNLNTEVIWNDIIKRWEPAEFDQDFTEDIDTIADYEFRNYDSVYGIAIDDATAPCVNCHPMAENTEGAGFAKAHKGVDSTSPCSLNNHTRELQNHLI